MSGVALYRDSQSGIFLLFRLSDSMNKDTQVEG